MNCVICRHGSTEQGKVTVTLQRGDATIIIKDVPAQVCENCGEYFLDESVSVRVLAQAEAAASKGGQIEMTPFAA